MASAYEQRLVPGLFQTWVETVGDAAQIRAEQRVLDVACGTGALARSVAPTVGPAGRVVGLDINPGMLAVAERLAPAIEWQQGSAEALPFDNDAFDAVICQFGLMLFTDPQAALQEMVRVLSPGGHLAVAVFDDLNRNTVYAALISIYERLTGKRTADALRAPFSMGDTRTLLPLFGATDVDGVVSAREERTARFVSVRDLVLADVDGWFPLAGLALDDADIDAVVDAVGNELARFVTPAGAIEFPVHGHIVTARKV